MGETGPEPIMRVAASYKRKGDPRVPVNGFFELYSDRIVLRHSEAMDDLAESGEISGGTEIRFGDVLRMRKVSGTAQDVRNVQSDWRDRVEIETAYFTTFMIFPEGDIIEPTRMAIDSWKGEPPGDRESGGSIPPGGKFRQSAPRVIYCIYCGNPLPAEALYCRSCGKKQKA